MNPLTTAIADAKLVVKALYGYCWNRATGRDRRGKVYAAAERIQRTLGEINEAHATQLDVRTALLERLYEHFGDVRNQWEGRHTMDGQRLLIDMRDLIAEAHGHTPQQVQDDFSCRKLQREMERNR